MLGFAPLGSIPLGDDGADNGQKTGTLDYALAGLSGTLTGKVYVKGVLSYGLAAVALTAGGDRTQKANPDGDVTTGSWTNELGGTTNLYASIDEAEASDTDYISSPVIEVGGNSYYECSLEALSDPLTDANHVVRYRIGKASGGATMNAVVSLRQGSTEIASWTHSALASTITFAQTLTAPQADAISDYADLRLRFYLEAA